ARIQQISHAQPATAHLVLICRPDTARGGADLHPSGSVLRTHLNHAVVRQDYVSAVGDKEVAVNLYAGLAQHAHFFEERQRVQHHAVANHGAAALAQHSAGHKLQHKFLTADHHCVAGIVPAGITRHHGKAVGEHVHNFALALVAPLSADNHRCLTTLHSNAHSSPVLNCSNF